MPVQLQLEIKDGEVSRLLESLEKRTSDWTPVMREIGEIIRESVMKNFREGKSPEGEEWKPSKRALGQGGKTLIDTAILRNSIHVVAGKDHVIVGTPVEYAGVHQFGAQAGSFGVVSVIVKAHLRKSRKGKECSVREHSRRQALPWGDISARPFMGIRDEDWPDIREALLDHVMGR